MSNDPSWYFSRGDAELYDKCPRARYHRTIGHTGRGIVRSGASFEQSLGRIIHKATEQILLGKIQLPQAADWAASSANKLVIGGEVPAKIPVEFHDQFSREAQALASGLVWAWGLHVLPDITANYNVIAVEQQTTYRRDGMVLPTVADVVLESKDDQTLVYPDWKTTAWVNGAWILQWNTAAQLHTTAKAVEQVLGRPVEYCYVQALVKGRWEREHQNSPLCWGWHHPDTNEWVFKHTARKGWIRKPQWMSGMNIEQWVRKIPREHAMRIVPRTPPIIVDEELAETWWRQRVLKEQRIQRAKVQLQTIAGEEHTAKARDAFKRRVLDEVFPQHFDQCAPVIGFRCDFHDVCHDPIVRANPLASGLFKKRPTYQERQAREGYEDLLAATRK